MVITWIDKKSVLYSNKRRFKAGDSIPAGILSQNRIDSLLIDKKIKIDAVKKVEPVKIQEVKPEIKKPYEKKKSAQEIEDDELAEMFKNEGIE